LVVTGPSSRRYLWEPITIATQLERTSVAHGEREALVAGELRLTWSDVRAEARAFAKAIIAARIEVGAHVAVWLPNQVEWVIAWFGTAYAGGVVVPINSRYRTEEVRYILRQSDSRVLLMRDAFLDMDYGEMLSELLPLPELRTVVSLGTPPPNTRTWDELIAAGAAVSDAELEARAATVSHEDPTIIVYTSGTTGHPKGAVHSHLILRNECSIAEWMDIGPDSRVMGHMPFFHVAGAFTGLLPPLIAGGALVLMDHWDPALALELIERERVTVFTGIPTHFIDLLDHPDLEGRDTSSLHSGCIGGASNPPEVIDGVITRLAIKRLLPVYGMTETTSVTTFPKPDDPREVILSGKGVPVADFEVRVVDPASGEELGPGVEGEISVRGHCVMQRYYRNPEATAAAFDADGWFRTGDLGVLDDDGYLAVTGRRSDMFIVGGANAYPAEIENALAEHPTIAQAYVVGVPDSRLGEVGFAFVQCRRDAEVTVEEVVAFCKRRLADYKVPRHVEFVVQWPLTATGKIQRYRLREMAAERAGRPA
jgi:fatty-acyl-CoA synthase